MSIEKLQRIRWRLEDKYIKNEAIRLSDVEAAIHQEVGMDRRTVKKYIKLLKQHRILKRLTRWFFMFPTA